MKIPQKRLKQTICCLVLEAQLAEWWGGEVVWSHFFEQCFWDTTCLTYNRPTTTVEGGNSIHYDCPLVAVLRFIFFCLLLSLSVAAQRGTLSFETQRFISKELLCVVKICVCRGSGRRRQETLFHSLSGESCLSSMKLCVWSLPVLTCTDHMSDIMEAELQDFAFEHRVCCVNRSFNTKICVNLTGLVTGNET